MLIVGAALVFASMAGLGLVLAFRIVPIARQLAVSSTLTLEDYSTRTAIAADLDSAFTDLTSQLRLAEAGTLSADSLTQRRLRLETVLRSSATLAPLNRSTRLSNEVAHELELADLAAHEVAGALLGVVGLIEIRELTSANELLHRSEALIIPLNQRMTAVTRAALADLTREEERLARQAQFSAALVVGWLVLGIVLLPALWWLLSNRLFTPLAAMDNALGRIERGDFDVELDASRDDELGRLNQHFNHTTQVLRAQRAAAERAAVTAALEASEAHYRSAFEEAAVGLAELSLDGQYMRINRAMTRILGRAEPLILGHHFLEFAQQIDGDDRREAWDRFVRRTELPAPAEATWVRGDGSVASVQVTGTLLCDADLRPRHLLAVVYDVTEQRRLEGDLLQARKLDAVGQLAGGVAHDFNNLLTGIIGYAELLEQDLAQSGTARADAAAIRAIATRGADLASSLLTLARRSQLREAPFMLDTMVRETVDLIQRTFDRRISIRVEYRASSTINGDRSLIANALLNLALNARDAMPHGGVLTIIVDSVAPSDEFRDRHELIPAEQFATIAVEDTGTGIAPQILDRLFEPFFTTKTMGSGTGLGLATAYGTVKAHGGALAVESVVGQGATFTIFLPSAAEDVRVPDSLPRPVSAASVARVLVVDDEAAIRLIATRLLRQLGYEVESADDGLDAVARLSRNDHGIDVVIMDGNMPRLDGVAAARQIHARFPDLPIIYASGNFDPTLSDEEGLVLFRERLAKPYGAHALSRAVARCLSQHASRNAPA